MLERVAQRARGEVAVARQVEHAEEEVDHHRPARQQPEQLLGVAREQRGVVRGALGEELGVGARIGDPDRRVVVDVAERVAAIECGMLDVCLLYTSPSPRDS